MDRREPFTDRNERMNELITMGPRLGFTENEWCLLLTSAALFLQRKLGIECPCVGCQAIRRMDEEVENGL